MDWNKMNELLNVANHLHLVWDMVGAFSGKEPAENARGPVKGMYGIFGKKDERIVHSLIMGIDDVADQGLLVDFFGWLFTPEPDNIQQWLESVFFRNDFFVFVAKKHEGGGPVKIGEDKTVIVTKDGEKTTTQTITKDISSKPGEETEAVKLIDQMLRRITAKLNELAASQSRLTLPKRKDVAFRATYEFYRKSSVPMRKVGETDWVEYLTERFNWTKEQAAAFLAFATPKLQWLKAEGINSLKAADQWLADEVVRQQQREAQLPWYDRLLNKLLPF